jgi:hypothetical protein
MKFLMMLIMVCTSPLCGRGVVEGGGVAEAFFGRALGKKVPPTRLRAWASDRYEAPLCMCRYISLAMYHMLVYGCAVA